jgi:hypothetical protein
MRHSDIAAPYQGTMTHPYLATIAIEPTDLAKFERLAGDQQDIHILGVDRSTPDMWTIYAACPSELSRDMLESAW